MSLDTAFKTGASNDYSAAVIVGLLNLSLLKILSQQKLRQVWSEERPAAMHRRAPQPVYERLSRASRTHGEGHDEARRWRSRSGEDRASSQTRDASSNQEGIMAVCCDGCGTVVRVDSETVVSRRDWYSHRVGTCPICGRKAQWHRRIAGRLGSGYRYTYRERR
jgi:hypothetical protein